MCLAFGPHDDLDISNTLTSAISDADMVEIPCRNGSVPVSLCQKHEI